MGGVKLWKKSLSERLEFYSVREPGGCQIWTGGLDKDGFPKVWSTESQRGVSARRQSFILANNSEPDRELFSSCGNNLCINPDHLRAFTDEEWSKVRVRIANKMWASRKVDDKQRLLNKIVIVPESECWKWNGKLDDDGYGLFWVGGANRRAHRASYVLHGGVIPDGMDLDHLCNNRCCVNPFHLEPKTPTEHQLSSFNSPSGKNRLKKVCDKGHPFDRVYGIKKRYRVCTICNAERQSARKRNNNGQGISTRTDGGAVSPKLQ